MADILFPPGRMIGGNLDKCFPVFESDGKTPKIGRDGKQMEDCSVGVAIPKGAEKAWWETPWGKLIYETGAAAHPNLVATPTFSWKVIDGDSTVPNKNGKRPCDKVGHPGHWVLWFSQGWLPKRVNADGTVELPEGAIVPGYYIQVFGSVAGNKLVPNGTPGVYLNPIAVALVGHGEKIATDVDTTSIGFGAAPLPAGAQPVPSVLPGVGGAVPPMPGMPTTPGVPTPAPAPAPAPAAFTPPPMPAPAPAPVGAPPAAPNMQFLTPGAPPPPPVPAGPVMTAKAAGVTYEAFKQNNWTDEQLREQGYMQ